MEISKNLITHWANLFESDEKMRNGDVSYLNDGAGDKEVVSEATTVNKKDDGSRLYSVKLWWGSGYTLDVYDVYADSEEEALEKVVAYIENTDPKSLEASDDSAESTKRDIMRDKGIEDENEAEDTTEFQEQFMYVDATTEGAKKPHYIWSENLGIEEKEVDKLNEATIKGFTVGDIGPVIDNINRELRRVDSPYEAEILGSDEDWTIVLKTDIEMPNFDSETYSSDSKADLWADKMAERSSEAEDIVFDELKRTFSDEDMRDRFDFVYVGGVKKLIPKPHVDKLIKDAIRNLVDAEYDTLRKLPSGKRMKYFMMHSMPRFALAARENGISNSSGFKSAVLDMMYNIDGIGSYGYEDFSKLLGGDLTELLKGIRIRDDKAVRDVAREFDYVKD